MADIHCEWLVLCRAVDTTSPSAQGGHSLLGVVGRLGVDGVPARSEPLTAAFRICGEPNHPVEAQIEVLDPDGAPLLGSPVISHWIPSHGLWDSWVKLGPIPLQATGAYTVRLKVNRVVVGQARLLVGQILH